MTTVDALVWFSREDALGLFPAGWCRQLSFRPPAFLGGEDVEPILAFREEGGRIGVPLDWGLQVLDRTNTSAEFHLSEGRPISVGRLPDPEHPSAPPGQGAFFQAILEALHTRYSVLAQAQTGSGKTVAVLNAIGRLGRSALVIVPTVVLARQWVREAKRHLGLADEQIGMIGEGEADWEGKSVTVAVIHNLVQRAFPPEFYPGFGLVAYDECHRLGARSFSQTMGMFPALHRIGVTATPDRKDGCAGLFMAHLGEPCVYSSQESMAVEGWQIPFRVTGVPGWVRHCQSPARPMAWLSGIGGRNRMIAGIAGELYRAGRSILVLTSFADHAELLLAAILAEGVPSEDAGLYTRQRTNPETGKRKRVGQPELDRVAASARVIVATRGMAKEGMDIPRLDAGIEALPTSDPRQEIGRVRRMSPGKRKPIWAFVSDSVPHGSGLDFLAGYSQARLRRMREAGVNKIIRL